jgi:tRNA(Ile)-lysidine synthase
MANSRKSKSDLLERVANALRPVVPQERSILLGLSGGMDSVVLLHLLHTLAPRFSWQLSALHIHHGISPNADVWAKFCEELCARYGVPLIIEHVDIAPLRNEHGIEAAARKLRHAAFSRQACDFVALAHHADDQAETLLLQLLRGAGIKGVAAMPLLKPATTLTHATLRPLLNISRDSLLEYAQKHELIWIEDESNADDYYPRNFLRKHILPKLEEKFPAYRDTLLRSAKHFADASVLLDELARQDAHIWIKDDPLDVTLLHQLSLNRSKNLLRYFLHASGAPIPQSSQLDDMLHQIMEARKDASVCVEFGHWQVRRYQNKVYALPALPDLDSHLKLAWHEENELEWTALNKRLLFTKSTGQGISLNKLQLAPVTFRFRSGQEKLRPHHNASTRSLKNLLQEKQIPPWLRDRLPLMYCGDELVCVVGVAIAQEYQAQLDEEGLLVFCK